MIDICRCIYMAIYIGLFPILVDMSMTWYTVEDGQRDNHMIGGFLDGMLYHIRWCGSFSFSWTFPAMTAAGLTKVTDLKERLRCAIQIGGRVTIVLMDGHDK